MIKNLLTPMWRLSPKIHKGLGDPGELVEEVPIQRIMDPRP